RTEGRDGGVTFSPLLYFPQVVTGATVSGGRPPGRSSPTTMRHSASLAPRLWPRYAGESPHALPLDAVQPANCGTRLDRERCALHGKPAIFRRWIWTETS